MKALVYDPCGFVCTAASVGGDNAQYGSVNFRLDGRDIVSRVAKLTPTKNGLFVAVWKREADGATHPLDAADRWDLLTISVREGDRFGQFVFSREVLREHGVVSAQGDGGKRGFRVYPPWVDVASHQAAASQCWQVESFLEIDDGTAVDVARARALYHVGSAS
ncbi:MepB family protein [Leifsonia kafniensis]|uniref:MepB family protein n=1 Tax=Leifsonia kafniensis TaxID=475957 RepID=A0ABP7KCD1_9MICO